MIRFLTNALGSVLLVGAVMFAVADIARSLADDDLRVMSLGEAFAAAGIVPAVSQAAPTDAAFDGLVLVSGWPAAAALMAGGFLLLFLARSHNPNERRYTR